MKQREYYVLEYSSYYSKREATSTKTLMLFFMSSEHSMVWPLSVTQLE